MLIQVAAAFLIGMALLGMAGRLRFPGGPPRLTRARKCAACGRHRIGRAPCDCGA